MTSLVASSRLLWAKDYSAVASSWESTGAVNRISRTANDSDFRSH